MMMAKRKTAGLRKNKSCDVVSHVLVLLFPYPKPTLMLSINHPSIDQGRKKKRKHRDNDQEYDPVVDKPLELDPSSKPKKRKKNRAKAPASPTDAEIEASSHASAAALLSAIVAASVSNTEPSMAIQYDSQAIPQPHQPFAPYPHPFNGSPAFHCDPISTQTPSVFPSVGNLSGAPFSQLAFGSNEDVLRALQDLDITKIASVLKTLGEAAAAADAPNPASQVNIIPSELQPPPSAPWQVPVASNVTLGIPPKQSSTSASKNSLNMNSPGREQHTNPDHAYLLANKWLNATKLAELVRNEGLTCISELDIISLITYRPCLQEGQVLCDRRATTEERNREISKR